MEKTNCKFCSAEFEYEPIVGLPFSLKPTVCSNCDERQRSDRAASERGGRYRAFQALCPRIYQDSDPNHPGMPRAEKTASILGWKRGPAGLLIYGATRKGKTRCAWMLVKRLIVDDGLNVIALSSVEFANHAALAASTGSLCHVEWKQELFECDVLFIDDLGKNKMTELVEADLFDVIETRTSNGRPIIITTNFVGRKSPTEPRVYGEALDDKFSPDRGAPLIARLREFTKAINL